MTPQDATLTIAPDNRLSHAAAHLYGAVALADTHALADGDDLLSAWTNTAHKASIAAGFIAMQVPGAVAPASHPDCASALRAALTEIALLRPDIDLPAGDLVDAMDYAVQALQLAQPCHDTTSPGRPGACADGAGAPGSAGWST